MTNDKEKQWENSTSCTIHFILYRFLIRSLILFYQKYQSILELLISGLANILIVKNQMQQKIWRHSSREVSIEIIFKCT